jgi:hypothetical protein
MKRRRKAPTGQHRTRVTITREQWSSRRSQIWLAVCVECQRLGTRAAPLKDWPDRGEGEPLLYQMEVAAGQVQEWERRLEALRRRQPALPRSEPAITPEEQARRDAAAHYYGSSPREGQYMGD